MPPKKEEKKKAEEPTADDGSERELVEKELVIGYLKSKLGRYQEQGDQLQVENIKLSEELETQKANMQDINEFLTNELKARSLTTSALESKVFELSNLLEELRKGNEAALSKLRVEKERELEAMRQQLAEFERKGRTMQDFLEKKEAMEQELHAIKAELTSKVKDYEYRLTDMDRAHIQDREKWKRDTMQKIKETKIQMMKLTDNQLEMTTKRTIMENEQMSIELHYQSKQTEKLLAKNTVLLEENQDLRQQLALSRQTQEELARRNNVYQKTIKSLLGKLQEQGAAQEQSTPFIKALEERVSDLELALHLAQLNAQEQTQQIAGINAQLMKARSTTDAYISSHDAVVRFLTQSLEDVRSKIVTVVQADGGSTEAPASLPPEAEASDHSAHMALNAFDAGAAGPAPSGPSQRLRRSESQAGMLARSSSSRQPSGRGPAPSIMPQLPAMDAPELTVVTGRLEDLSQEQRERVLSFLLERMHVFMHQAALAGANATSASAGGGIPHSSSARFGRRPSARIAASAMIDSRGSVLDSGRSGGGDVPGGSWRRQPSTTRSASVGPAANTMALDSPKGNGRRSAVPGSLPSLMLPPPGALAASGAPASASWPATTAPKPATTDHTVTQALPSGWHNARTHPSKPSVLLPNAIFPGPNAQAPQPLPAVEDLLAQVMADVRPWGKKAPESAMVPGHPPAPGSVGIFGSKLRPVGAGQAGSTHAA